jgi:hypothetical protein
MAADDNIIFFVIYFDIFDIQLNVNVGSDKVRTGISNFAPFQQPGHARFRREVQQRCAAEKD